jgi:molybdopterin-biosynthesis enzyme MoeA-like protein
MTATSGFANGSNFKSALSSARAPQQQPISEEKQPLKFNLPYSLAPVPQHLQTQRNSVNPAPKIVQRKDVKSYFRPTVPDMVREMAKRGVRSHLNYVKNTN